ncbi:MAG TPA: HAD-IC family P-type ATPase [Candidatus Limnocylindrales bacterium]
MGGIALTRDVTQAALAGLSEAEAARRLEAGEGNERQATAGRSYARILWQATFLPINLVLFVVAGVLVVVGLPIDAALTALPVLGNIVVSAGMEASAKYRLDRLRILSTKKPTVIRDGIERSIDPSRLVRGDLVVIARGDQIVLDGDLVDGQIEVDESLLTGESDPVVRHPGEALRSGAVCVSGRGVVRVTHVGMESYANQLTSEAQSVRAERTPLQRSVDQLIGVATALVVVVSVVVAVASRFGAGESAASITQAAAVLVALVPQGLAIMVTVTYASAALRISRAGALVQRINSVESMSRVDTLVLDKTGTITAPRFELREHVRIGIDEAAFRHLIAVVSGQMPPDDRIGAALHRWVAAAEDGSASASPDAAGSPCPVSEVVPFSSARRWSGMVLAETGEAVVLGAPEVVLPATVDGDVQQAVEQWTNGGLRTLVLARGTAPALRDAFGEPRLPSTVAPVAVLAFSEEIRPDAAPTLAALQRSGVALKVVSGDNPRTVAHIAGEAGLEGAGRAAVDGRELSGLDEEALGERADGATVIGRVEPSLKARIVQALRDRGRYVGMTGDGVNDVLALKTAQLGIAMESGSGATRAVADIVLLGDRFSVLPKAVVEGRKVIDAMIGSSSLLLTRTFYMLLIVLGAALGGLAFPFTPRNNSLLALITVGLPSLVVVAYARPVQSQPDFLRTVLRFAVPSAIAVVAVALPVYVYYLTETGSVSIARSALVTITTFCGTLLIPILAESNREDTRRGRLGPLDWRPTALALALVVLFGALMALPIARWFYEIEPIPPADAVLLGLVSIGWALVVFAGRRLVVRAGGRAESGALDRRVPTAGQGSDGH